MILDTTSERNKEDPNKVDQNKLDQEKKEEKKEEPKKSSLNLGALVGGSSGAFVLLAGVVGAIAKACKKRPEHEDQGGHQIGDIHCCNCASGHPPPKPEGPKADEPKV